MQATTFGVISQQRKSKASLMREWSHYREHVVYPVASMDGDKKGVVIPLTYSGMSQQPLDFFFDCQTFSAKGPLASTISPTPMGGVTIEPTPRMMTNFNPNSWAFDGQVGSYVRIPNLNNFHPTDAIGTVGIRFYIPETSPVTARQTLFAWGNPSFGGFEIHLEPDGRVYSYGATPNGGVNYHYSWGRYKVGWNFLINYAAGDSHACWLNGDGGTENVGHFSFGLRSQFNGDIHIGANNLGNNPFIGYISEVFMLPGNYVASIPTKLQGVTRLSDYVAEGKSVPTVLYNPGGTMRYDYRRDPVSGDFVFPSFNTQDYAGVFNMYPRIPALGENWTFDITIDNTGSNSYYSWIRVGNQMGANFGIGWRASGQYGVIPESPGNWYQNTALDTYGNPWYKTPVGYTGEKRIKMTREANSIKCEMWSGSDYFIRYVEFSANGNWNPTSLEIRTYGSGFTAPMKARNIEFLVNGEEGAFQTWYGRPTWNLFELSQWASVRGLENIRFLAPFTKTDENLAWTNSDWYPESGNMLAGGYINPAGYLGYNTQAEGPAYSGMKTGYGTGGWGRDIVDKPVTIETEVYLNGARADKRVMYGWKRSDDPNHSYGYSGFSFHFTSDGRLQFVGSTLNSVWTPTLTSANPVDVDVWHHVAVTRDSSHMWRMYLDDVKVAEVYSTNPIRNFDFSAVDWIGLGTLNPYDASYRLYGRLRWMRILVGEAAYTGDTIADHSSWHNHIPGDDIRVTNEAETQIFESTQLVPFDYTRGRYSLLVKIPEMNATIPTKLRIHFGNPAITVPATDVTMKASDLAFVIMKRRSFYNVVTKQNISLGSTNWDDDRVTVINDASFLHYLNMNGGTKRFFFQLLSDVQPTDDFTILFFGATTSGFTELVGKGYGQPGQWNLGVTQNGNSTFYKDAAGVISRSGINTPGFNNSAESHGVVKRGTLWSYLQQGYKDAALNSSIVIDPTAGDFWVGPNANGESATGLVVLMKRAIEFWEYELLHKAFFSNQLVVPSISGMKPHIEKVYPSVKPLDELHGYQPTP